MFTPQEIEEKTFVKAVFGGYDMASVDEFLEPLTEDYIALYKENAVLKSKMKILVEKLEEYRAQEDSMKKALVAAQKTSDAMVAEAEKKCAQLTSQAENIVRSKISESQQQISAEEDRIERAKQAARNFIEVIEKDVSRHLDLLNNLKLMNLGPQPSASSFDFHVEPEAPKAEVVEPVTVQVPVAKIREAEAQQEAETDTEAIAHQIEQNLEKVIGPNDDGDLEKTRVAHKADKFADLQFGKNFTPDRE